jgi:uncharacterized protein (DUF342 family)
MNMTSGQRTSNTSWQIEVSDDAMTAYVQSTGDSPPSPEAMLQALEMAGVQISPEVESAIAAARENWSQVDEPLILARGTTAAPPRDDVFRLADHLRPDSARDGSADRVDHYAFNSVVTVAAGQSIGRIEPGSPGREGRDVFGRSLPISERETQRITVDDQTVERIGEEVCTLRSRIDGRVVIEDNQVTIRELFVVPGDVDFATGHIDSAVEVLITGTVRDRFEVKSKKMISVHGAIEAARVRACGDVQVVGGVAARGNGLISSKGNISVRFCSDACLTAGGDIVIHRQAMNSQMLAAGRLIALRGSVIGGFAHAMGGAELYTVGSEANVRTRLAFGAEPAAIEQVEQLKEAIRKRRDQVNMIRDKAMPLVTNFGRLSQEQRAQVTELLEKADIIEDEVVQMDGRYRQLVREFGGEAMPRVRIARRVHPGVIISVGKRAASVQKPLVGPLTIELRQDRGRHGLATVDESSGRVQTLPDAQLAEAELRAEFDRASKKMISEANAQL